MGIYQYEAAFGAADKTSRAMRKAIEEWFRLYYLSDADKEQDPCQRIAYTVVNKLTKTVFGEYAARAEDPVVQGYLQALDQKKKEALQLALMGGECYLKPCPVGTGFSFTLIPRNNVLIFGRNPEGEITDMGTMEKSQLGKYYFTLLERRSVDGNGYLTITNKLYRSFTDQNLGTQVSLRTHPGYARLADSYRFSEPVGSVGVARVKTPMVNCVDGSADGVAVYAPAVGLIHAINRNEAQLSGEFERGQSRIIVSADMLNGGQLTDNIFVGLDEDPETVGMNIFSPPLREQSYLARKQEYLRNVESVVGLKRGMLSDANVEERTATEISASNADYSLTVMDFQDMWQKTVEEAVGLCLTLAKLYDLPQAAEEGFSIDWGNGVLYDEDATWSRYMEMVQAGLLKPEVALGWRFNMKAETAEEQAAVRQKLMPNTVE